LQASARLGTQPHDLIGVDVGVAANDARLKPLGLQRQRCGLANVRTLDLVQL
jgi:hypothetical protein